MLGHKESKVSQSIFQSLLLSMQIPNIVLKFVQQYSMIDVDLGGQLREILLDSGKGLSGVLQGLTMVLGHLELHLCSRVVFRRLQQGQFELQYFGNKKLICRNGGEVVQHFRGGMTVAILEEGIYVGHLNVLWLGDSCIDD